MGEGSKSKLMVLVFHRAAQGLYSTGRGGLMGKGSKSAM